MTVSEDGTRPPLDRSAKFEIVLGPHWPRADRLSRSPPPRGPPCACPLHLSPGLRRRVSTWSCRLSCSRLQVARIVREDGQDSDGASRTGASSVTKPERNVHRTRARSTDRRVISKAPSSGLPIGGSDRKSEPRPLSSRAKPALRSSLPIGTRERVRARRCSVVSFGASARSRSSRRRSRAYVVIGGRREGLTRPR